MKPLRSKLLWRCVMRWRIWKRQALALSRLTAGPARRPAAAPLRLGCLPAVGRGGVLPINAAVAKDDTQIRTHMCYCEFNDIMDSIAALVPT